MLQNDEIKELRKKYIYPNLIPYYQEPLQLVKAQGSYVWDEKGHQYIDAIGGIVCISVGHNHPRIKKKIMQMLEADQIQHTTFLYLSSHMAQLAEKLANQAPDGLTHCYFTNSGSEANEVAILTAREATGEQVVLSLRHGYHGGTATPLNLCGHSTWKFKNHPHSSVVHAQAPYCYRCPFKQQRGNCALECAEEVKDVIATTTCGQIAAAIIEPILGVGGFIDAPLEYHHRVYEIVKSVGGLYISDEVQTGVGRIGENFFAIADSAVTPDLITMAKGLGSGAPIGAVIAKEQYAQALKGKLHFNTFGGDPYQSMQAAEVIGIIEEEQLISNAKSMGQYIKTALIEMQSQFPIIGDVRGRGLLLGVELVEDQKTKSPATAAVGEMMEHTLKAGLLIGKGGLLGNVLRLCPALNIGQAQADEILEKLKTAFTKLSFKGVAAQ